jgi:parallel beta-helix repeat protein
MSWKMFLQNGFRSSWRIASLVSCFAAVVITAIAIPASSGTKATTSEHCYVSIAGNDRNDGSAKKPWASLQHAAENVKPGSTVHVAPGTYQGAVTTSRSGRASARIRFISEVRWGALVRSVGTYATWTNEGDFVDIVGFDVSGDGYIGVLNRGSNVRIIANHVHHIPAPGCTGNGGAGIVNANYGGIDNDIISNVVHDIGDPDKICARVQGIYHSNLRGQILNNISYRNQGYGIHLWHAASDVTIANNLVFNNHYGGILIGAGDAPYDGSPSHPADRILVANNLVVYNQNRYGIEELGVTGTHNLYVNNLVYGNHPKDWKLQTGRQQGTITADPHFLDYRPEGSGDYHLSTNSPAVSNGTSLGAPSFDFDGYARPRAGTWDIGPYQSGTPMKYPWPPDPCSSDCTAQPGN